MRGYGLVDSTKVAGRPGQTLNLVANAAPSPAAAAVVYPAAYWYSMMKVPAAAEVSSLPGGVNQYLAWIKNLACVGCHQIGQLATRTLPPEFASLPNHHEAWVRRIQSGQAGAQMLGSAMNQLGGVPPKYLADWTERVAKGELPHAQPQRPRGVERNIVATVRDWSDRQSVHARLVRHGPPQSDRQRLRQALRRAGALDGRVPDPRSEDEHGDFAPRARARPEHADDEQHAADTAVAVLGQRGDLGQQGERAQPDARCTRAACGTRPSCARRDNAPAYCKADSSHPSAKLFPLTRSGRQLAVYDPKTEKYTFIDTCYSTHHLQFARTRTTRCGPAAADPSSAG